MVDNGFSILAESKSNRKNKENVLVTDGEFDYLIAHNGRTAIFNIRKTLRKELIRMFDDGFMFYENISNGEYRFRLYSPITQKAPYYLHTLIAAKKYRKKISTIVKNKVRVVDKNPLNLLDNNVEWCSPKGDDINTLNSFIIEGDKFVIAHVETSRQEYVNADDELIAIIKKYRWSSGNNRLYTVVGKQSDNTNIQHYLYHYVYAFYNMGMRENNVKSILRKLRRYLNDGYVIDHLNDNCNDNRHWNLSMMLQTQNVSKRDIISKIGLPFFCNCIYTEGKYRVVMSHIAEEYETDSGLLIRYPAVIYEFESAEKLIRYLQFWYDNYTYRGLTPYSNYRQKKANGEKIVRYELKQADYERMRDAEDVLTDLPDCTKMSFKQFMALIDSSPPDFQEQIEEVVPYEKMSGKSSVYVFMSPLNED